MNKIVVSLGVMMSLAGVASAAPPYLPQLPMSHSADSKALYQELNGYAWGCPKDNEATKRALVDKTISVAAKIGDEYDRTQFTAYATELDHWFDVWSAGTPDGTWAELKKTYTKARTAFDAMPASPPSGAAEVTKAIAIYAQVRTQSEAVGAIHSGEWPCPNYPGNWWQLYQDGLNAVELTKQQRWATASKIIEAYQTWLGTRAVLEEAVPKTYWAHVQQTAKLVDLAAATEALAPRIAELEAWKPELTGDEAKVAAEAAAQLADTVTAARTRADAQLAEIAMPALKQDKKRTKLIKSLVAKEDGQLVGIVVSPKGTSKDSWSEEVEVSRDSSYAYYKTYKFVRERYSMYYAWKPTGATGDVCELWHQSYMRYKKGSPGTDKSWQPYQSWKEGYVSCAAAGKTTKKKMD